MMNEYKNRNQPRIIKKKKNSGLNARFRKDMTLWYGLLTLVTIIVNILVIYVLFYTTRFSALSQSAFKKVNLIAIAVLLLLDLLAAFAIKSKKIAAFAAAIIAIGLGVGAGGYAVYAVNKVDTNLEEITAKEHDTDINISYVVYTKNSNSIIMDVEDLSGKKIGAVDGTDAAAIGLKRLENEGINITYVNFLSFADTFKALISEEIDCAILPANYANAISTEEALEPYIPDTASILTFTESVVQTGTDGAEKDLTSEPFTVLLTGENEGLADTIIVVSVNPVSMEVTMTSIARDSYVPITCYGYASSKINSAHAVSEACLVDTVSALTGIEIDYTVEFNFASVIQVVDAVGGVDVYNPVGFYGQCWNVETDSLEVIWIPEGNVHLTGQQALGFARERHAFEDGDFSRQMHQQEIIEQVVKKVMDTRDPNTYLKILDAAGANIRTNLSTDQMVQFVSYAMKKARRYYNQSNPVGTLNIISSRITGWSAQMWDDSLAMYLYIYFPFNGACADTKVAVDRNTNLYSYASIPESVYWDASETYVPPVISYDWYDGEVGATVIGGPPEPEPSAEPVPEEIVPEDTEEPGEEIPADDVSGDETPEDPGIEDPEAGN